MRKNSAYAKTYDGLDIIYDDGVHWFTKIKIFFKVDYKICVSFNKTCCYTIYNKSRT